MPEVILPAIVLVACSERGRSERAGARSEHGTNYVGVGGRRRGRRLCASFAVVGSAAAAACRRFSDQECGDPRGSRSGRVGGVWVGASWSFLPPTPWRPMLDLLNRLC
jgi:hypothetical protein